MAWFEFRKISGRPTETKRKTAKKKQNEVRSSPLKDCGTSNHGKKALERSVPCLMFHKERRLIDDEEENRYPRNATLSAGFYKPCRA